MRALDMSAFKTIQRTLKINGQLQEGSTHTLIARWDTHDDDIVSIFVVGFGGEDLHDLVIDNAGIWVINGAVTTEEQLRVFFFREIFCFFLKQVAESVV